MDLDPDTLPDELVIALRAPVRFPPGANGIDYAELRLREPTAGDLKKLAGRSGTDSTVHLIHLVSGLPIGALDLIGARDLKKAGDYLGAFFGEAAPSSGEG